MPILFLAGIIYHLVARKQIGASFGFIYNQTWDLARFFFLFPVLLLMFVNWSFEALKWKTLTKPYYPMSFKHALQSCLSGISTALNTPNRIGDFIGKIAHLPNKYRQNGLHSSFYSSYSQGLITLIMGWIGWVYYGDRLITNEAFKVAVSAIGFLGICLLIYVFFKRSEFNFIPKKWRQYLTHSPHSTIKLKIFAYSFLRYLVFATQFYLLLRFMGINLGYITVFLNITLFYLVTSFIPMAFWGEIGVKESVAVWVFSGLIFNSLIIVGTILLLWLINLMIPSLIGNYFLLKKAYSKE